MLHYTAPRELICRSALIKFWLKEKGPHLTDGPRKAVADIRDAEAEALRAALGVSFLQIIKSWLAAITVFPLNIFLQVRVKD